MNKDEAFNLLVNATAQLKLDRQGHDAVRQALQVVQKAMEEPSNMRCSPVKKKEE